MKTELDIIIEAVKIIRKYPDDKNVLREQLGIIEKYAKKIRIDIEKN